MAALFGEDLPPGFCYQEDFVSESDECDMLEALALVVFEHFTMRGVVARRRVAFFGQSYSGASARPLPQFLLPLRAKFATWAGVAADAFAMALINEYPPGAPIGWHRDAPQYDITAGLSLGSATRMTFRPYRLPTGLRSHSEKRTTTHEILLARRSAYLITGESRNDYEHHIPPVAHTRYSVTFRTSR